MIFSYAAGTTSIAKSLIASTYLFLNSHESQIYHKFEEYCGEEFKKSTLVEPMNLKAEDCIKALNLEKNKIEIDNKNPINKFISSYEDLKWKKLFKGFYEYSFNLSEAGVIIYNYWKFVSVRAISIIYLPCEYSAIIRKAHSMQDTYLTCSILWWLSIQVG